MSHYNFGVVLDCVGNRKFAFGGLLAVDDFPLQLFSGIEVEAIGLSDMAAGAHNVEIILFSGFADGVVVSDAEGV